MQAIEHVATNIQKANAARATQKLAAGRGQQVALNGIDVEHELARRLAGIDQVENAVLARDCAYRLNRVDQPAVGGNVSDRDQAHALVDHGAQRVHAGFAALRRRNDFDLDTLFTGNLQVGKIVRRVLGLGGQDAVTRLKPDRVKRHHPADRGIFDDGHFVTMATNQACHRVVTRFDLVESPPLSLVTANRSLQLQMFDLGLQHAARH